MLKRFSTWGLKYVNFDESGFFLFKFDDVNFKQKLVCMGPLSFGSVKFVFHPNISKYPPIKSSLNMSPCWVQIYDIPAHYWSIEWLGFIAQLLGKILHYDGDTWKAAKAKLPSLHYAKICLIMCLMHNRPQFLYVVVSSINGGFTHARVWIVYLDDSGLCSLRFGNHLERCCGHRPMFEMEFSEEECSNMFMDISSDSNDYTWTSSTAESSHMGCFMGNYGRGLAREVPRLQSPVEEHDSCHLMGSDMDLSE